MHFFIFKERHIQKINSIWTSWSLARSSSSPVHVSQDWSWEETPVSYLKFFPVQILILPSRRVSISSCSAIRDSALDPVLKWNAIYFLLFTNIETKYNVIFVVHGGYSLWSTWRACSVTCGKGIQKRSRLCNNPFPANGGKPCQGSDSEMRNCQRKLCPGTPLYSTDRHMFNRYSSLFPCYGLPQC